jgi:hypothetical protein
METKSSSLKGPLWVIAIGILILAIGACFTAYMLWDAKKDDKETAIRSHAATVEAYERTRPNLLAVRTQLQAFSANYRATNSSALNQAAAPSTSASIEVNPTVGLPPPPRVSALQPLSGGGIAGRPAASIFGRVTLRGTPPPEKPLPLDALCGKLHNPATPPTTRFYVVSPQGGLADVLVYLRDGTQGRKYPLPTNTPVIDQIGCEFVPHVLSLQAGQRMIVRNSDPLMHNNHFTPVVPGNGEVNRAQLPRGADQSYTWSQPEIFLRLKCDVHPWMFAYLGVVDHPFHAVTDTNGQYRFDATPPGRYVIEAVHRKTHLRGGNGIKREIEVRPGEPLKVDFEVTVPVANQ